jgi:hypothetical protein
MAVCNVCGNDYDKSFEVVADAGAVEPTNEPTDRVDIAQS